MSNNENKALRLILKMYKEKWQYGCSVKHLDAGCKPDCLACEAEALLKSTEQI